MPLVTLRPLLNIARDQQWSVGAFNPVDYCTTKVIIDAATELDAPVIAQTSMKTVKYWGIDVFAAWVADLAEKTPVPVVLHLDHGKNLDIIKECIDAGWSAVMIDASDKPFDENLALTGKVQAWAEDAGIFIEAELGAIGGVEEDISVDEEDARLARIDQAVEMCETYDLGVFAPAIGTAHGVYKGEPRISFERLEEMYRRLPVPFALHGGTGLSDEIIQRCITLGCSKINISTNLKYRFIDGFCTYHQDNPADYEPLRVIDAQYAAVKALVKEKIEQFGGAGRAGDIMSAL